MWGDRIVHTCALNAVHNTVVLEEVASMNFHIMCIKPNVDNMQQELLDKPICANAEKMPTLGKNRHSIL